MWFTHHSGDTYDELYIARFGLDDGQPTVIGVEVHGAPGSLPTG